MMVKLTKEENEIRRTTESENLPMSAQKGKYPRFIPFSGKLEVQLPSNNATQETGMLINRKIGLALVILLRLLFNSTMCHDLSWLAAF